MLIFTWNVFQKWKGNKSSKILLLVYCQTCIKNKFVSLPINEPTRNWIILDGGCRTSRTRCVLPVSFLRSQLANIPLQSGNRDGKGRVSLLYALKTLETTISYFNYELIMIPFLWCQCAALFTQSCLSIRHVARMENLGGRNIFWGGRLIMESKCPKFNLDRDVFFTYMYIYGCIWPLSWGANTNFGGAAAPP